MPLLCLGLLAVVASVPWLVWAIGLLSAPRSRDAGRETRRVILLAAAPIAVLAGVVPVLEATGVARALPAGPGVLAPWSVAMWATGTGLVVLGAWALRRSGPAPAPDADDAPLPSDRLFVAWTLGVCLAVLTPAVVLGLWNRGLWPFAGAALGACLAYPVLIAQRGLYHLLARGGPPSPRRLLAFTVGPLALVAALAIGATVVATRPVVLLRLLLAPPSGIVTDVRLEARSCELLDDSRWDLSLRVEGGDLAGMASALGFRPDTRRPGTFERSDPRLCLYEALWLDPASGRANYEWLVAGPP